MPAESDILPTLLDALDLFKANDEEQALEAALATVRNYCGWHLAPVLSQTVTLHSPDQVTVFLPTTHLVSVDSVTQLGAPVDVATMTVQPDGTARRLIGYRYLYTNDLITVQFTHGYAELPEDVRQVVLSLTQRILDNPASGRSVTNVGQVSTTFFRGGGVPLMDADQAVLDPYRILAFA